MEHAKHHIIVIYDSVFNSVFESQVIAPLQSSSQPITIVSFESNITNAMEHVAKYTQIQFKFLQRYPFMGCWSLYPASFQLRRFLKQFNTYTITARGPLAGYVCLQAYTPQCEQITIQARGLLAEEYGYIHPKQSLLTKWRKRLYQQVEQSVYSYSLPNVTFQAVSPELKQYLINVFGTNANSITIANHDIPQLLPHNLRIQYKQQIRNQLNIPHNAYVVCYNGSAHAWQCPKQTIAYFAQQTSKKNYVLLLLTNSTEKFKLLLEDFKIKPDAYRIMNVKHSDVIKYLAACDEGIVFRTPHSINWVSRPTKALEYHAAGLTIKHNNTVAYLTNKLQQ